MPSLAQRRRLAGPIRRAATAVVLVAAGGLLTACGDTTPPRPNVLVYVVDTLRADALGPSGSPEASTPHFDALAREGVVFENAWANASWTRASMATALTGLLPWHHGAQSRDDRLPESARTLAELFAEQGYATALVTANPNVGSVFGFRQAFEEVSELYARSKPGIVGGRELVTPSDVVTHEVVRWLRTAREPFFVVALSIDPHYPYRPPRRHDPARHRGASSGGDAPAAPDGGGRDVARERELYRGEVAFNDESFGALVRAMQALGLWDDTLVVVTSDHGEEFFEYGRGGHGKSLTEEVLRVPLILRRPADPRLPPGARVQRPISLVDLAPTLLDLAGIPAPEDLDGRSWLESATAPPRPVLAGLDLDGHRLFAVVDPPYKLVWDVETGDRRLYLLRGPSPEARPVDPATDPAAAAAVERLTAALEESLAAADRSLERSTAGELPEEVESSLRALGYLE